MEKVCVDTNKEQEAVGNTDDQPSNKFKPIQKRNGKESNKKNKVNGELRIGNENVRNLECVCSSVLS